MINLINKLIIIIKFYTGLSTGLKKTSRLLRGQKEFCIDEAQFFGKIETIKYFIYNYLQWKTNYTLPK